MTAITRQSPNPEVAAPPRRVALAAALAIAAGLAITPAPPASAGGHPACGGQMPVSSECTFIYNPQSSVFVVEAQATGLFPQAAVYVEARDEDGNLLAFCYDTATLNAECSAAVSVASARPVGTTLTCRAAANVTGSYSCRNA